MSNRDSLENFVTSNRDSFDDLKAPAGVWSRIEKKERPVHHLWKWSAVAASALLLIAVGYIIGDRMNTPTQKPGWAEFQETENFYQGRINQKLDEVKALPVSSEVLNDLQMLDEVYAELKNQLREDPNADAQVLLAAMVRHNKKKLEVLEKIIHRVSKYQNDENQNREI